MANLLITPPEKNDGPKFVVPAFHSTSRSTFSLAWPPLATTEALQLIRPMAIVLTSLAVLGTMQQEMKEMMQKEWGMRWADEKIRMINDY